MLAFRIVSRRDVAVMMCEDPAVKEVKRNRRGSFSHSVRSIADAMTSRGDWSSHGSCECADDCTELDKGPVYGSK